MKNSRTKKLTTAGMLCALAYIAVVIVSVVEMVTISSTGVWGCMMNMKSL